MTLKQRFFFSVFKMFSTWNLALELLGANTWLVCASAHVLIDLITDLSTKGCFYSCL